MRKILIDAHMIGENESGNETYVINLIKGLKKINTGDVMFYLATTNIDYLEYTIGGFDDKFVPVKVSSNPIRRLLWEFYRIEKKYTIDLFLFTYHPAYFVSGSIITIVHDISFKIKSKWFSLKDKVILNIGLNRCIRVSDVIVTISNNSKNDILKYYGICQKKIKVIYLAPMEFTETDCKEKINFVDKPFILVVGGYNPRKNLKRIFRAYHSVKDKIPHYLVVAGNVMREYVDMPEKMGISDRVIFTGYLKEEIMRCLYKNADMLLYPSLYEGFGLPIVEAMAEGTPVITSNIGAVSEISRGAALLVDPYNENSIADGILQLLHDEKKREELIRKGYEVISKLSWKKTAQEVYNVFMEVLKQ